MGLTVAAIENLKAQGWRNELVTQTEWDNGMSGEREPALYAVKSALNSAFTPEGRLITPLEFRVAGNVQAFIEALAASHILASHSGDLVMLMPTEFTQTSLSESEPE